VALVAAAGLAVRCALIAASGPPERFEYDDLARHLVFGEGYVYNQLGTPYRSFYAGLGYIAINAATDWLFPDQPKAMAVMQSFYACALVSVVFLIARRFFSDSDALIAAALVAFHPALLYYDARKLHPLGFDTLMMMLAVWLVLQLRTDRRVRVAAMTGVVLGLAIFQRGSMMLFCAGSLAWLAWVVQPRAQGLRLAMAYGAGVLLVLAPWAARNYAIHGMVMLESMTMQQLWKGNASYSNGSGYLAEGRNMYDAAPERLVAEWRKRDETGQFRLFRDEALAEMRSDPARAAALVAKKFVYFWTAPPNSGQSYPARFFDLYLAYYAVMVILAGVGMAAAFKQPRLARDVVLILIYFASLSIVHAIMFVEMRHRWGAEPLLLAFAPGGARAAWSRWSR
jgi:4-amino-4-deoxy-L-arabinose transferase-like glycosyltransferase